MALSIKIRWKHTAHFFVDTHSGHTQVLSHTGKELLLGEVGHLQTNPDCPTSATFTCLHSFLHNYICHGITFPPCFAPQAFSFGNLGLTISILKQQGQFSPCSSIYRHNLIANASPVLSLAPVSYFPCQCPSSMSRFTFHYVFSSHSLHVWLFRLVHLINPVMRNLCDFILLVVMLDWWRGLKLGEQKLWGVWFTRELCGLLFNSCLSINKVCSPGGYCKVQLYACMCMCETAGANLGCSLFLSWSCRKGDSKDFSNRWWSYVIPVLKNWV